MNCPNCGTEMEKGRIRVGTFLVGVKWIPEKNFLGTGGSSINIRNDSSADRCPTCGTVVFTS